MLHARNGKRPLLGRVLLCRIQLNCRIKTLAESSNVDTTSHLTIPAISVRKNENEIEIIISKRCDLVNLLMDIAKSDLKSCSSNK